MDKVALLPADDRAALFGETGAGPGRRQYDYRKGLLGLRDFEEAFRPAAQRYGHPCAFRSTSPSDHFRPVMIGQAASPDTGIQATATILPWHYASEESVARALGKSAAAALIEGKLPTTKNIRSGDLGEIYATE
jgi:hypothetical protein